MRQSNGLIWQGAIIIATAALLSGCAGASSDGACTAFPAPVAYSTADQQRALAEMNALPDGAVLPRMIEELGAYRARWRAVCR